MTALHDRLRAAVSKARDEALLAELLANESLTIGELASLRGSLSDAVRNLTIGDLRRGTVGGTGGTGKSRRAGRSRSGGQATDTRTPAGRAAYESKLLAALQGVTSPVSAPQLRRITGGTADQARRALNRLIERGKVKYTGKARGTRYLAK